MCGKDIPFFKCPELYSWIRKGGSAVNDENICGIPLRSAGKLVAASIATYPLCSLQGLIIKKTTSSHRVGGFLACKRIMLNGMIHHAHKYPRTFIYRRGKLLSS